VLFSAAFNFWKSSEPVPVFWKCPFIALLKPILESESFENYLLSGGFAASRSEKQAQDFFQKASLKVRFSRSPRQTLNSQPLPRCCEMFKTAMLECIQHF
jgi:hypothetical protein